MPPQKRPAESSSEEHSLLHDAVTDLTGEVRVLSQHVEVLRIAVDDLRQEVEWALRQHRRNEWLPTPTSTSAPSNPLVEDVAVSRPNHEQLPPSTPAMTSPAAIAEKTSPSPRAAQTSPELPAATKLKSPSRKGTRLDLKLYFQTVYADLVRFIGYGGKPLKEVQAFVQDLEKKYGRDKIKEAGDDVAVIESHSEPYMVRLRDDVRKLAVQMLGPPPEPQVPAEASA